jgi:hypothetical protein
MTTSINTPALKSFRVVVIEWLTHDAVIEAEDEILAEDEARRLWATNAEHQLFSLDNSGIDGIVVEEVAS